MLEIGEAGIFPPAFQGGLAERIFLHKGGGLSDGAPPMIHHDGKGKLLITRAE